jgi:uncharacterized membrane protein
MFVFLGAALLNVYAIGLILCRALVYRTKLYRPMLWNIWLSIVPLLVLLVGGATGILLLIPARPLAIAVLIVTGIIWLLLLPNASYLITELNHSHRRENDPVPFWFDIILVITLAMSGVLNTVLNVFLAHAILSITIYGDFARSFLRPGGLITIAVILILLGLGMYLGRYPRFNSWDVRHPGQFVRKLRTHFSEPGNIAACVGFTLTYAVFLALMYIVTAGPLLEGMLMLDRMRGL